MIILQAVDFSQCNVVPEKSNQVFCGNLERLTDLFTSTPRENGFKLVTSFVARQIQTPFCSL